ncbi:hypothetical protein C1646_750707 [Rhizophagus diaphanus]|nr:hypothetical protein C1646_750707 [Rhizophagus diaphanus] [Rhizophagus sp. MUCL 43196]
MFDNIKMYYNTENANEWIKWIEEAIDKELLNYCEYTDLETFKKLLKIQRKVDFHDNIIRCYGITKYELVGITKISCMSDFY